MKANLSEQSKRSEIIFKVERDEESGWLTASWDAPHGKGEITTQGKDLRELEQNVREAVHCHFENGKLPGRIRLHFVNDAVLARRETPARRFRRRSSPRIETFGFHGCSTGGGTY